MLQTYATPAYASETEARWNTPKAGVHSKLHAEDQRRNIPTFQYGTRGPFLESSWNFSGLFAKSGTLRLQSWFIHIF